jgi:uncharacterized membrane protein
MIDLTNVDLTKKENQTLRNWFAIMWQNFYIGGFIIGLAFFIAMVSPYAELFGLDKLLSLIPLAIMGFIGYKGFYQFWNDLKQGTSR